MEHMVLRVDYPEEFLEKAKELYPHPESARLHELLAAGVGGSEVEELLLASPSRRSGITAKSYEFLMARVELHASWLRLMGNPAIRSTPSR